MYFGNPCSRVLMLSPEDWGLQLEDIAKKFPPLDLVGIRRLEA